MTTIEKVFIGAIIVCIVTMFSILLVVNKKIIEAGGFKAVAKELVKDTREVLKEED